MKLWSWKVECPVLCAALLFFLPGGQAQNQAQNRATYAPADIAYGSQIFVAQCVRCHGTAGDQVPGVNLGSGQFKNASSDADLRRIILGGVPGTAMQAQKLDPPEVTAVVAYLRNMRDVANKNIAIGDASHGKVLFEGTGNCGSCHRVNGKGPRVAPDLSDIGALRTAGQIEQSLVNPTEAMLPMNRSVRAVTREGKVITGRRLNEDTYTVQLMDDHGNLLSLDKAGLREYTVITTSSMPSYKDKLSSQDLADVLAYLLSLKGAQ